MKIIRQIILFTVTLILHSNVMANNSKYYREFQEIFDFVDREYVEEPDKQKMVDAAIQGMLTTLDPHSSYLVDEDFEDLWDRTKGQFGGIGVEIIFDNNFLQVISPIDDLPADRAGIKAGDYLVAVDGESVQVLGFNKSVKKLRGEPGTTVKIGVYTKGDSDIREVEITREIVKIKPVKVEVDNDIAYIRVVTFNEAAVKDLRKIMKKTLRKAEREKQVINGIVLDLRNNPGGIIEEAVGITEYFIDSGVVVTTKGRTGRSHSTFTASKTAPKAPDVPLVVLINGGSASASEIVAGAIRDHNRGILLGTKSFGKGSVQDFIKLSDRAGIKLTSSKYYTPSGKSIQGEGITPDLVVEQIHLAAKDKENELSFISEKLLKNHLKNPDEKVKATEEDSEQDEKQAFTPSDRYKTDYQYSRAVDLLRGLNIMTALPSE